MGKRDLDLVLFDMDGTLYPDDGYSSAVFPRAALEVLRRRRGLSEAAAASLYEEARRRVHAELGARPTNTRVLLSCFEDVTFDEFERQVDSMLDLEGHVSRAPAAVQAVARVCAAYPTALYTTNNDRTAARVLARIGMDGSFPPERRFTVSSAGRLPLPRREQVLFLKPAPRGFLHLMELHRAAPGRTLMVGDSEDSDLAPARRLGLLTYRIEAPADLLALPGWLGLD